MTNLTTHAFSSANLALLLAIGIFSSGDKITPLDLEINFDQEFQKENAVVLVDVFAVTDKEKADHIDEITALKYFDPADPTRRLFNDLRLANTDFRGVGDLTNTFSATETEAVEKTWKAWADGKKTYLVIMAYMTQAEPGKDQRLKQVVPLRKREWKKAHIPSNTKRLIIQVLPELVNVKPDSSRVPRKEEPKSKGKAGDSADTSEASKKKQ